MESWFLADQKCLADFFGPKFNPKALPKTANIEDVATQDLLKGLKDATRNTKKGGYLKGGHAFEILGMIDPNKIEAASPFAQNLFAVLRAC